MDWCPVLFYCWVIWSCNKNALEAKSWVVKMSIHHHNEIYSITLQVVTIKLYNCKKSLWYKREKDQIIAWFKQWVVNPVVVFYLGSYNCVRQQLQESVVSNVFLCYQKHTISLLYQPLCALSPEHTHQHKSWFSYSSYDLCQANLPVDQMNHCLIHLSVSCKRQWLEDTEQAFIEHLLYSRHCTKQVLWASKFTQMHG